MLLQSGWIDVSRETTTLVSVVGPVLRTLKITSPAVLIGIVLDCAFNAGVIVTVADARPTRRRRSSAARLIAGAAAAATTPRARSASRRARRRNGRRTSRS